MEAAYRKYPNPHSSNVHTLDTIQRRVTSTGGLFSQRIFGTIWSVPTIALNVRLIILPHSLCMLCKCVCVCVFESSSSIYSNRL